MVDHDEQVETVVRAITGIPGWTPEVDEWAGPIAYDIARAAIKAMSGGSDSVRIPEGQKDG